MRFLRVAAIAIAAMFVCAGAAAAHPLGNFTVNHLARITMSAGALTVKYVLDEAEIPTFALDRSLDQRGTPTHATLQSWAERQAATIAPRLLLDADGRRIALRVGRVTVEQRPGAGGLPTLYFTASYRGDVAAGPHRLTFRDATEEGRLGWRDVVLGDAKEPTRELRSYPSALLGSPRAQTSIAATLGADGTLAATSERPEDAMQTASAPLGRSNALSDVLARGASDPFVVLGALLLAIALGALHALEPGHGKTLLAVSLVGARATTRQAFVLASALTAAHTAGVLALGFLVLFATQWIVPEQIYPWITLGSGVFVAVLGARALAREIRRRLPFAHEHPHEHPHAHPHAHEHVHAGGAQHHHHGDSAHRHDDLDELSHARAHAIPGTAPLTFRSAVIAAASGNVAPCPAALVVLLAAISLHQVGYGLALIVAFSIGLAAVLTVLGIAVVRSAAWLVSRPRFDAFARYAPLVTAFVIAAVGAIMIGQGLGPQLGVSVPVIAALVLAATVGYGFAWHRHPVAARASA